MERLRSHRQHGSRSSIRKNLPFVVLFFLLFTTLSSFALPLDVEEPEMLFNKQFFLALLPFVAARPAAKENLQSRAVTLDQFITSENSIAYTNTFANIGTNGAKPGVIIASPSTNNPNYLYTWIRDASLTTHALLDVASASQQAQVISFLGQFLTSQGNLQRTSNPSGSLSDLSGLGEPKFNIDETAFTGAWGRPQRDGPSLRALALMKFVELFPSSAAGRKAEIDGLIKNDLDYVVKYFNAQGFDLWEEVNSYSFFTSVSHFHALALGSQYFKSSDATRSANYLSTSKQVRCFIDSTYWATGANKNAYISNTGGGRGGLDANSIIAAQLYPTSPSVAYTSDPCSTSFFSPCSDRMLATTYAVVESFRGVYAVNSAREAAGSKALAIGRYKEDVYYNGNPWYLTTLAPAEQMYRAVSIWNQFGAVNITSTSLPFFKSLVSTATVGTYRKGDGNFEKVTAAVSAYADAFMSIVQQYTPSNGALAEQYSRQDGTPLSARDLTWSYAAFLTATHYRAQQTTATAPTGANLYTDASCSGGGGSTSGVNFKVAKTTAYGQNIYLAGSATALGAWDLSKAVPLNANAYTASSPIWQTSAPVNLPAGQAFQYKYVLKGTDGSFTYENGNNRQYTAPASGSVTLSDTWQN